MSSTPHPQPRSPWAQRLLTPVARAAGRLLNNGRNDGPPDLDELWRDFNRKLSGMFGGKPSGPSNPGNGGGGSPDMKGAGIGIGLIAGVVALGWLASGFFIVQEGQQRHHVLRQVQQDGGGGLPVAPALPLPGA